MYGRLAASVVVSGLISIGVTNSVYAKDYNSFSTPQLKQMCLPALDLEACEHWAARETTKTPKHRIYYLMSKAFLDKGNLDRALAYINKASQTNEQIDLPLIGFYVLYHGSLFERIGDYNKALRKYNTGTVILNGADCTGCLNQLLNFHVKAGYTSLKLKDHRYAYKFFSDGLKKGGYDANLYLGAAKSLSMRKKKEKAMKLLVRGEELLGISEGNRYTETERARYKAKFHSAIKAMSSK